MRFESNTSFPKAIDAPRKEVQLNNGGRVAYYTSATASDMESGTELDSESGRPLLLLHSINAGPSSMEVRPLFMHYENKRPVFALDLPGFGASSHDDIVYSSNFYSDCIAEFISTVIGQSTDLIALSLSAEFSARVANNHPDLVHSLCMISPTGLTTKKMPGGTTGAFIERLLRKPFIGTGIFRLLTSKFSIRYFLGQYFKGPTPKDIIDYAYITSHQPGAHYAPFSFVSGRLFDQNAVENLYKPLRQPVLVLYDWDPNISFELLPTIAAERENWRVVRIPDTAGLPHWEATKKTTLSIDGFWRSIASAHDQKAGAHSEAL